LRDRANTSARFLTALCFSIVAVFAALASPALAAQTHPYTGTSFGPDGVGGTGNFERVQGIAVDPANGDTYVYDGGAGKIFKFNSAGAPVNFSVTGTNAISGVGGGAGGAEYEIALAAAGSPGGTAGDIYLANNGGAIHVYSPAGAELGELDQGGETCGVATDPSGNFYAGVYSSTINKYTPSANPPINTDKTATGSASVGLCNVAADGLGNVYAANFSAGLYKLEGIGDTSPTKVDPSANTMAIAPGSNDLYADRGNEVFQYDSAGTLIGSFGNGDISGSHGVAVNSGASKIYVGTATKVKVFGPSTTVPDAITEAADAITRTTATLHGTVGAAGGPDATCVFQYVTESAFFEHGFEGASEKPCAPAGPFSGSGTTAVSTTVTGLSTTTGYRFRLLATSSNGSNGGEVRSFSTPGAVNVLTDPATDVTASGATLHGTVNPEGTELEECSFEYRHGFGTYDSLPCAESPATIGSGNSPVSVHVDLTGLVGGTEYEFRLAGRNEFGSSQSSNENFKTLGPSVVGSLTVSSLDTRAKFTGQVNPNSESTTYRFEYVTKVDFESSGFANAEEAPVGGASAGSGSAEVEVEAEVDGLQPNTAYVSRLIANNASGNAASPLVEFRTNSPPTSGLPDGRSYEEVTPPTAFEKNAATMIISGQNEAYSSPSGDAVTYRNITGAGETESSFIFPLYIARRGADDWTSAGFNPPASLGTNGKALAFTEDLRAGYTMESTYGGTGGIYLYEFETHKLTTIFQSLDFNIYDTNTKVAAESAGGGVVLLQSSDELTSDAVSGKDNVYAWTKSTGKIQLVSILPDGTPAAGASAGPFGFGNYYNENVINRDGTKAFFTAQEDGQIYMRTNPASSSGTTTLISASQKTNGTDPNGPQPAEFLEATRDGRFVFFASHSALTNDANTGAFDQGQDIYRYDTSTGELIDLAPEPNQAGSETLGLSGISSDGSYAYFVAQSVLAPGATEEEPNLYVWHQDEGLKYVATLSYSDEERGWTNKRVAGEQKTARVAADGHSILFFTSSQTERNPRGEAEVYRWEFGEAGATCVSCNPTGLNPSVDATLQETPFPPSTGPSKAVATRNLSADGKRVVFSTSEALVPNDVNGVEDVYEWEANGKGSCRSELQNGGCLYLISTGTSPENSYVSEISEDGNDIFFFTGQRLVGQDKDDLGDEYDARVGGGLPSQNPAPVRPCEGEACRSAATAPTAALPRGTSTFSGSGNEKSNKKKHHKKKHRKSKSHKKSHRKAGGNR
jgi:hypothetical protein